MDIERIRGVARQQKGLFTRRQAREAGFSTEQVRRRLATKSWQRVRGSVLAESGLRVTRAVYDRAAQLGIAGSVLAGPSAAAWWGMPVKVQLTWICVSRRRRGEPGLRVLVADLPDRDRTLVDGVPITSRERTVFDCLRVLPEAEALDLLDLALQRQWITVEVLAQRLGDSIGRHGVPQVVRLMRTAVSGSRFPAERRCAWLLTDAGVRGWTANTEIRDSAGLIGIGDVVFERQRLVVELDGWAFHSTPDRFQRDRQRQNRLIAAGWTVLRFTWRDLTDRPHQVISTIREVLGARLAS